MASVFCTHYILAAYFTYPRGMESRVEIAWPDLWTMNLVIMSRRLHQRSYSRTDNVQQINGYVSHLSNDNMMLTTNCTTQNGLNNAGWCGTPQPIAYYNVIAPQSPQARSHKTCTVIISPNVCGCSFARCHMPIKIVRQTTILHIAQRHEKIWRHETFIKSSNFSTSSAHIIVEWQFCTGWNANVKNTQNF